jgi:uncharacterized protein (DUF1800 family)
MATLTEEHCKHILRRMGFGGAPDDIDLLFQKGTTTAAVNYMIDYEQIDNSAMESALAASFDFSAPLNNTKINQQEIRRRWVVRMILSKRQFEEKMTLFWHNHFATAISKVGSEVLMQVQNETLRTNALGRFDDLLLKVSQDPAMLIWLDTRQNRLNSLNENFGREVMELFTMGILDVVTGEAPYTEADIKQVARCFTGWDFVRPNANQPFIYSFRLVPGNHDNGSKTVFAGTPYARTGNLDGTDIVSILSARPSTPRYLVKKFFDFFVYPLDLSSAADRSTTDRLASVYLSNNHSIKELARAIFSSDEFFSDRAQYALIKNPVECVVGPIRMLGADYNAGGPLDRRDNQTHQRTGRLGMLLFEPPDVAGWDPQLAWINTALMLERYNVAEQFAITRVNDPTTPGAFLTLDRLRKFTKSNPKKTVNKFLSVLNVSTDNATVKTLRNYLQTDDNGNPTVFDPTTDTVIDKKIRGLVHLIMSLPEFQLN